MPVLLILNRGLLLRQFSHYRKALVVAVCWK